MSVVLSVADLILVSSLQYLRHLFHLLLEPLLRLLGLDIRAPDEPLEERQRDARDRNPYDENAEIQPH